MSSRATAVVPVESLKERESLVSVTSHPTAIPSGRRSDTISMTEPRSRVGSCWASTALLARNTSVRDKIDVTNDLPDTARNLEQWQRQGTSSFAVSSSARKDEQCREPHRLIKAAMVPSIVRVLPAQNTNIQRISLVSSAAGPKCNSASSQTLPSVRVRISGGISRRTSPPPALQTLPTVAGTNTNVHSARNIGKRTLTGTEEWRTRSHLRRPRIRPRPPLTLRLRKRLLQRHRNDVARFARARLVHCDHLVGDFDTTLLVVQQYFGVDGHGDVAPAAGLELSTADPVG